MKTSVYLLAVVIWISSCKGKPNTPTPIKTSTDNTLLLKNNSSIPINYVVYNNLNEYANNGNTFINKRLMPGESYSQTLSETDMQNFYYTDWYSDDHAYARWNHNGYVGGQEFTPDVYYLPLLSSKPYTFQVNDDDLQKFYHSDLQQRFLNGGTQTTWKVIDIYKQDRHAQAAGSEPISVWSSSTSAQRSTQIIIRKDLTATLINDTAHRDIKFQTSSDTSQNAFEGPHLFFKGDPDLVSVHANCKVLWHNTVGIDSMILYDEGYNVSDPYDYYYIMKRQ